MATVRKRTRTSGGEMKTAWIADYFDQGRVRHVKTFTTKKAAAEFLVDARHEVKQGTHTAAGASTCPD